MLQSLVNLAWDIGTVLFALYMFALFTGRPKWVARRIFRDRGW